MIEDCGRQDPEFARQARTEICTVAVNLLWENEAAPCPDPQIRRELLGRIRSLLPGYLRQSHYGIGRKFQAIAAALSPRIYMHLKKAVRAVSR